MVQINSIEKGFRTQALIAGLLGIWEASVRASHHFLTEDDIRSLCPQAEEAIRQIETLWVVEDENVRIGFMGIQSGKIEMLFLHPDYFREDGILHIPPGQHRRPGQPLPYSEDETSVNLLC